MTAPIREADHHRVRDLLLDWLTRKAEPDGIKWVRDRIDEIRDGAPDWKFYTSFSGAPRFVGKKDLELSDDDLRAADTARAGWTPSTWSTDQAARTLIVLNYPHDDPDRYLRTLDQVFSTADVRESVALYQCLPLFPFPERWVDRAAEGLRTSMTSVFNAVAHHNPYPAEAFEDAAWNQMVLKALFVGSSLHDIQGLDARANAALARMLIDYVHERRAAGRPVPAELWRPIAPFADTYLEELSAALRSGNESERAAAALALANAGTDAARQALQSAPDLVRRIEAGELTWDSLNTVVSASK